MIHVVIKIGTMVDPNEKITFIDVKRFNCEILFSFALKRHAFIFYATFLVTMKATRTGEADGWWREERR